MKQESLTEAQIEASITSLLADLDQALTVIPDLLDPMLKRRGRRRSDAVQGPGQQRRRLQLLLAQAALLVAQAAVAGVATAALVEQMTAAQRCLGDLQRLGQGFIETRDVLRPHTVQTTDPTTDTTVAMRAYQAFGPYAYYRWREGKKLRSLYLGRADQPAEWSWKLVELGVDLEALGLADEAASYRTALEKLEAQEVEQLGQLDDKQTAAVMGAIGRIENKNAPGGGHV